MRNLGTIVKWGGYWSQTTIEECKFCVKLILIFDLHVKRVIDGFLALSTNIYSINRRSFLHAGLAWHIIPSKTGVHSSYDDLQGGYRSLPLYFQKGRWLSTTSSMFMKIWQSSHQGLFWVEAYLQFARACSSHQVINSHPVHKHGLFRRQFWGRSTLKSKYLGGQSREPLPHRRNMLFIWIDINSAGASCGKGQGTCSAWEPRVRLCYHL